MEVDSITHLDNYELWIMNDELLENSACAGFSCCIFHQDYVKEISNEDIEINEDYLNSAK